MWLLLFKGSKSTWTERKFPSKTSKIMSISSWKDTKMKPVLKSNASTKRAAKGMHDFYYIYKWRHLLTGVSSKSFVEVIVVPYFCIWPSSDIMRRPQKLYFGTLHRGAFCQFPFRRIYYCHSSKSTGKETGKTHLCALCRVQIKILTINHFFDMYCMLELLHMLVIRSYIKYSRDRIRQFDGKFDTLSRKLNWSIKATWKKMKNGKVEKIL